MQLEAGKRRRVLQVSLTPLIDVVFILLLFFLLSSTFTQWRELNVVTSGETVNNEPQTLLKVQLISSQGEIRVEDQHYASADAAGLRELVLAHPNTVFALDAEDGVNTQAMITLADRLQQAGAKHVSLAGITR